MVYVYEKIHACGVCMLVEVRGQHWSESTMIFSNRSPGFSGPGFLSKLDPLIGLGWLANEHRGSSCLHFSRTRIADAPAFKPTCYLSSQDLH